MRRTQSAHRVFDLTWRWPFVLLAAASLAAPCCKGLDHSHGEGSHEHEHGTQEHGQAHGDHGAAHGGHDDHGHGHESASEVVTSWGSSTQLFVEFPALVAGEESPFAAHLTRLEDHFAIDSGTVTVELAGGRHPVERFTVEGPSQPGIFRPIVRPAHAGQRTVTLRLASPAASEAHEMGAFIVFAGRAGAEAAAAAKAEGEPDGAIGFLLEQQWKVPFRVEQANTRALRPSFPAFAHLTLPSDAEATIAAPRDGRLMAVGGRFPVVGEEVDAGAVLFALSTAPQEGADPASLDLAAEQASIRVQSAEREVDRLAPLVEQGVVARRRLDDAHAALSVAQAELRSARRRKSSLGQSQKIGGGGDGLHVPSPIAGTVAEMFVAPGAWVSEGQPIARIVDRDRLWLDVGVPEAYVGRLGNISGAWFELDSVRGVIELPASSLVSVGTELDRDSRTLPVRFALDNVRRELFAGMTSHAHLIADSPRLTVAAPHDAVIDDAGTDVVYVQLGGETFVRRPVRLGIRDGQWVEILDGVSPGEWVVTEGAYSVKLASTSTETIGHGHAH